MKIAGTVHFIEKQKFRCPNDGVHLVGKDGKIKGLLACEIDGDWTPFGMNGFYRRINGCSGVKVFYSFKTNKAAHYRTVKDVYRLMCGLSDKGIMPTPKGIIGVELDLRVGERHVKKDAYGIVMTHVAYPLKKWKSYAKGMPYPWEAEGDENPTGFLVFQAKARNAIKKAGGRVESGKLGDNVWCEKTKRWWLVDVNTR